MSEEYQLRGSWRVGRSYGIHVYECVRTDGLPCDDDRPVATFHRPEDAALVVQLYNAARETAR